MVRRVAVVAALGAAVLGLLLCMVLLDPSRRETADEAAEVPAPERAPGTVEETERPRARAAVDAPFGP